MEMGKVSSAIVAENMGMQGSFSVAFSAHASIGTLPIVWYGTPEQKQKYLPRLGSGEWIGAYALSEATARPAPPNPPTPAVRRVRTAGAEAEVPAQAGVGRVDWRVRAVGVYVGFRRAERAHPGGALRGRHDLYAERREDVDHQRRHRGPLYGLRQVRGRRGQGRGRERGEADGVSD